LAHSLFRIIHEQELWVKKTQSPFCLFDPKVEQNGLKIQEMKTGAKVSAKECNKGPGIKRNQTSLTTTWNYLCDESLTSIIRKTGKEQGSKAAKSKKVKIHLC